MDEVVDTVAAGIEPGNERRPRDGALGRNTGAETLKGAFGRQPPKVGQLAPGEELDEKARVETVEAEDHNALSPGATRRGRRGTAGPHAHGESESERCQPASHAVVRRRPSGFPSMKAGASIP